MGCDWQNIVIFLVPGAGFLGPGEGFLRTDYKKPAATCSHDFKIVDMKEHLSNHFVTKHNNRCNFELREQLI